MKNAGRAGIVPKDDFDINIKYKRLDAVMYDKSLYIAKKDVPLGTIPTDTTYWMKSICGNKEPIATTETAGIVKPDGTTITVDVDGTLHGNSKVTVDSELSKESENPVQNKTVTKELEKKLNSDGDSKDLTTTFTSGDSTNVTEWTDVGLLTSGEKHSSLFQKVATMFKNIRYLYHMLGTADISALGEGADIGTVTGALSKLNSDYYNFLKKRKIYYSVTELGLNIETCTLNDIAKSLPNYSEIYLAVGNYIYYEVPKTYGLLTINKTENRLLAIYHTVFLDDKDTIWFNIGSDESFRGWYYIKGIAI